MEVRGRGVNGSLNGEEGGLPGLTVRRVVRVLLGQEGGPQCKGSTVGGKALSLPHKSGKPHRSFTVCWKENFEKLLGPTLARGKDFADELSTHFSPETRYQFT